MPIKGLTTNHRSGSGFPRLGVLHKGAARTEADLQQNRPGKDLDHFRVEFEAGYEYLAPTWERLYGKEVKEISNVYLMSPDVDSAFSTWLEEWAKSGLVHRCDGEQQHAWFDKALGKVNYNQPQKCQAPMCQCKQIGRMNFMLPHLLIETGVLGFFTLQTHSVKDIARLHSLMSDLEILNGTLMSVPFVITRKPETFEVPKMGRDKKPTGERMKVTKSLIHIKADDQFAQERIAPKLLGFAPQLPANVDSTTGEVIQRPALPAPVQPIKWSKSEAKAWVSQTCETLALTHADLKEALGVSLFEDWHSNAQAATQAVNEWLDMQNPIVEDNMEIDY